MSDLRLVSFSAEHGLEVLKSNPDLPGSDEDWTHRCRVLEQYGCGATILDGSTPVACAIILVMPPWIGNLQVLLRPGTPVLPLAEAITGFLSITVDSQRLRRLQARLQKPCDASYRNFLTVLGFVAEELPQEGEDYVTMVFSPETAQEKDR